MRVLESRRRRAESRGRPNDVERRLQRIDIDKAQTIALAPTTNSQPGFNRLDPPIVNEHPNPYAVTTTDDTASAQPIPFSGQQTPEDLKVALLDSPPKSGLGRLQYPLSLGFILVVMVLIYLLDGGGSISSIIWPVIAYPLLPVWLWLIRLFSPSQKKRRKRIEESTKSLRVEHGWFDREHFVIYEPKMYLRASWSFFGPAYLFRDHLVLPVTPDSTHRIVLPFGFFREPAEARQAIELVSEQLGFLVNRPPKDHELAESVLETEFSMPAKPLSEVQSWDKVHWPFGTDDEPTETFEVDLLGGQHGWKFTAASIFSILLFAFWYFLPIWVASTTWLVGNLRATGGTSFLFDEPAATGIVLGPAAVILGLFLFSGVTATFRIRRGHSSPMSIHLRSTGVHLAHENFDSWFLWSSLARVIQEDNHAGWIIDQNKDEARFPLKCFANQEDFARFGQALRRLGPE